MAILELRKVSKAYGDGDGRTEVLKDIDLEVEAGEFVAIVGFSGSGKTTLMSIIAGLIKPDSGEALLEGEPIDGPGPDRGLVFQSYSLMPWLTVRGNVALAVDAVFAGESRKDATPAPRSTSPWSACPTPPTAGRRNCPAACASASRSPGRWP